jgi:hypothetical protein
VTGLTTSQDDYLDKLTSSDRGLLKEFYWVCCSLRDLEAFKADSKFDLHLTFFKRANLSLGSTACSALTHYFCELDSLGDLSADRTCGQVVLLGLRLNATKLHDRFLVGGLGTFNRLYQEYDLTVYSGLDLEIEEYAATLILTSHFSYASWNTRTANYFKHAQLLWDCRPPTPHWLGSAVDWTTANALKNSAEGNLDLEGKGTSWASTGVNSKDSKLFKVFKLLSNLIKD